jgi:hypothetical protein
MNVALKLVNCSMNSGTFSRVTLTLHSILVKVRNRMFGTFVLIST